MNRNFSKLLILSLLLVIVGGCGMVQKVQEFGSSNSNVEDKTRDALGMKKTGIPECDEVIDILDKKRKGSSNASEESWQDRAMTEVLKQQIYNYVNDGNANKSPKEKAELAGKCKTALGYLR